MKQTKKVVAAIIENNNKEVLCALRSPSMSHPNMWEFPGGKVKENEDIFTAVVREIKEELYCTIEAGEVFLVNNHKYENFYVELIAIKCNIVEGVPIARVHEKINWLLRENLACLHWSPADVPVMEQLIKGM
ncbi:8-oxo-dGTP diphosphatase [Salirhabdus euzebyi]|uniref:8-oxo-dGTP diphosphatase n=1 Tax=Salirhabdus euzebyi TaxID=394506 RepID=A0A841PUV4_9BACI|nr:(deoxy)nucleoside triphosphate pyrophosphohydrolase [Salirhabdus euzebyi]MBB6452649.1 8-oxo-dGTP diphosphatase [Salirhabdus euzebyi]